MDHLSVLDAGFLQAEDANPNVSLAIGAISVLDGPPPDFGELTGTLVRRLARVPRLRQVLHNHLFDIEPPEFEDRPGVDLAQQIKRAALPSPGDDAALFRLAADIIERRLDRSRPLWECWVIEGLGDNRWAILMKVHHCLADGVSTARILTSLTDNADAAGTFADDIGSTHRAETLTGQFPISLNPLDWGRSAARVVKGTAEVLSSLLAPAAPTSLLGPVSTMRRYQVAQASIADVHTICRAFDVTLNDVALSAITAGFRAVLLHRGEKPNHTSLRTLVPVSVRDTTDPASDTPDNRVSLMLPLLPVDRANPLDQLRIVHRRMTTAKASGQKQAGSSVLNAAGLVPFPFAAWSVRLLTRLPQHGVVTLATNVPGPREQLNMLGRKLIRMYPIPPIALRLRIGIAMLSYRDDFIFGIVADYDSAPDLEVLSAGIEQAIARLTELARRRV